MLLVSKVFSSQSFALRSSKVAVSLSPSLSDVTKRGISFKASKDLFYNYLKKKQSSQNPPEKAKVEPPPRWNPLKWLTPSASAATPNTDLIAGRRRSLSKASARDKYKLITDVDDTIVSSGGVKLFGIKLGGVDNRYKRGQFYPGVIQFALELSKSGHSAPPSASGSINVTDIHHRLPAKVAVLTARAREFKFALALRPSSKLNKRYRMFGESSGFPGWGIGDVYYGSVMEWIFHHRKGLRKFLNFEIMLRNDDARHHKHGATQHPPFKYILLGDTGEKDEEAGERMAAKYPDRVSAIFLHTVYNIRDPPSFTATSPLPRDRSVNGVPVYYFRTYVGAAVKAFQHNLISEEAVKRITHKAIEEMKELDHYAQKDYQKKVKFLISFPSQKEKKDQLQRQFEEVRRLRWQELRQDVDSCVFLKPFLAATPANILGRDSSIGSNVIGGVSSSVDKASSNGRN